MKRFFSILMVGMAIMLFPVVASATSSVKIEQIGECETLSDGTCQETFSIHVISDTDVSYTAIPKITFTYNPRDGKLNGVQSIQFKESEGWQALSTQSETGYDVVYTHTGEAVTSRDIDLGTLVVIVNSDTSLYDCSMSYGIEGNPEKVEVVIEIEETPNTGASLPVIVISAGVVIAAVVYVISKKNTKLYKI